MEESEDEIDEDMQEAYGEIKNKQALKKIEHLMKKKNRAHGKNKNASEVVEKIENMGIDSSKIIERTKKLKKNEKMSHLVKRTRKFK